MQRIRTTICEIPSGFVASYGQVAEIAGIARGARQVAYTLSHLPPDQVLPWHRVIKASGKIAFAEGTENFDDQSKRLMIEGVVVRNGKVDMKQYRWQPDLDELLWKPCSSWDQKTP